MTNNPLADLSVQQLKEALELREKIEALQQELAQVLGVAPIELPKSVPSPKLSQPRRIGKRIVSEASRAKMAAAQLARRRREKEAVKQALAPVDAKPTVKAEPKAKGQAEPKAGKKFGQLKESVIQLLKAAGQKGITLKEICGKLGLSQGHLNNWLYATGKKIKEIKKIGRGVYAWKE